MPDVHLRSIEPLIAIVLARVCGSTPQPHPAIAALLGRFLPRLGPLVATQAAFLFVCTPHRFPAPWGHRAKCRDRATAPFQHISNFGFSIFVSTNSANAGLISDLSAVS